MLIHFSLQGPDLVTLEKYKDVAEELLITLWDLAHPRVANDWMTKLEKMVGTTLGVLLLVYTRSVLLLLLLLLLLLFRVDGVQHSGVCLLWQSCCRCRCRCRC